MIQSLLPEKRVRLAMMFGGPQGPVKVSSKSDIHGMCGHGNGRVGTTDMQWSRKLSLRPQDHLVIMIPGFALWCRLLLPNSGYNASRSCRCKI